MTTQSTILMREVLDDMGAQLDAASGQQTYRQALNDPALQTWSYLPGDRAGLCLEDATDLVVEHVHTLLRLAHSAHGAALVRNAMAVERERRRTVTGVAAGGDRYWWRMIGDPRSGQPWGWRLNGHHVAVHIIVHGDQVTFTPHFIGSEPAHISTGPLNGCRILGTEEDLARRLLAELGPSQRRQATIDANAPADILTGMDPVVDPNQLPPGIGWPALAQGQRDLLKQLVESYLARLPEDQAHAYQREMFEQSDHIQFAWAGGGQPRQPHYYYVKSPTILIEYDNTQDDANHAHSVMRHLRDDFGGDPLRDHLRRHHTTGTENPG